LYLKEEIRAEALVRNLPAFTRFLPVAALFHGQVLSVAALARDVGAARTTIAGYLDILEDTLLAFRVPAFEARMRVRERKHPKLYWIDAGLVRAAKGSLGQVSPEERGPLFEGWIAVLLAAYRDLRGTIDELFYWAPAESGRVEVDFLLRRGEEFVAIEAKAGTRFTSDMTAGLRAIAGLKGLRRRVLVYLGELRLRVLDSVDVLPLAEFQRELAEGSLWP
jgi:predicted AAA+ superfamily ATPase